MKWHSFSEVVTDATSKFKKIKASDYKAQGKYKIIDQGKEPIAGYTEDASLVNGQLLPILIFGDHTRVLKYEDEPIALGADGAKALWVNSDLAISRYVYYYLRSIQIKEAGYSRHFKFLKEIEIPLPPLNDQIRIAHLLGKVEGLIAQRKQHLQQLDDLLKSVLLEMFGDPVRNEKGWDTGHVIDFCDVKGGKRIPKGENLVKKNTGFPYIKAGNIKNGEVTTTDLEFVTPEVRKLISRYTVNEGDVCITVVGANIGDIGIVPATLHKASLTENANKLLIKDRRKLNNHYLAHYLSSGYVQQQIASSIRAAGVPKLAIFRIEQMLLLVPPIDQQIEFEKSKKLIQQLTAHYQQSLTDLEALYSALSQKAFKGELDLSRLSLPKEVAQPMAVDASTPITEVITPTELVRQLVQSAEPQGRDQLLTRWFRQYLANTPPATSLRSAQILEGAWQALQAAPLEVEASGEEEEEEEEPPDLADYDVLKALVFKALDAGELLQTFDDDRNRVALKRQSAEWGAW